MPKIQLNQFNLLHLSFLISCSPQCTVLLREPCLWAQARVITAADAMLACDAICAATRVASWPQEIFRCYRRKCDHREFHRGYQRHLERLKTKRITSVNKQYKTQAQVWRTTKCTTLHVTLRDSSVVSAS